MQDRANMQTSSYSATLLTGMVIGGAMALLLTPKSGAEVRSDLRDHAEKMRGKAKDASKRAEGMAKRAAKQVADTAESKADDLDAEVDIRYK